MWRNRQGLKIISVSSEMTNQCVKNLLGVFSPSEDIWYLGTSVNGKNVYPQNIEKGIADNKIKYNCK